MSRSAARSGPTASTRGNATVLNQAADNTAVGGGGANRFAFRAYAPAGGITAGDLSVSSQERMPIYANATGANSEFNLVRVIPAAAGKTLVFELLRRR